ncbi:MAG: DUF3368 domain-containing protein [Thermodesulfobacteriota bacterium]
MAETAVFNASPLIFFSRGGHLELLRAVVGGVLVPEPVAAEIRRRGPRDPTSAALTSELWLQVVPAPAPSEAILQWGLGPGESAVLALCERNPRRVAVIDDLAGRKCASSLGIPVRGTLGIVLVAKRRGLVPAARPVLEDLLRAGMYLSRRVLDEALTRVGE